MIISGAPAQDPNEPFDVIRADGLPTGRVKARDAVHRDGDWHRAIHVWVAGFDETDPTTWGNPSRNDPCPCGSGKKFKHCHGVLA